jgi:chromosomal replication initiation ATPase DnaA
MEEIIKIVADEFGVTVEEVMSRSHRQAVRDARGLAIVIMVDGGYALEQIGELLDRQPKSVRHTLNTTRDYIRLSKHEAERYHRLMDKACEGVAV